MPEQTQVTDRMKPSTYIDNDDGLEICVECGTQVGESADKCWSCALWESETEREMLNELFWKILRFWMTEDGPTDKEMYNAIAEVHNNLEGMSLKEVKEKYMPNLDLDELRGKK